MQKYVFYHQMAVANAYFINNEKLILFYDKMHWTQNRHPDSAFKL